MKKRKARMLAILLAATVSIGMVSMTVLATSQEQIPSLAGTGTSQSKYAGINVNTITEEGGNPAEITSTASSLAADKAWFEYLTYSDQPVSSVRLTDDQRLIFYDPYTYSDSMIMEVTGEESEWSSANSLSVSYTTSNTIGFDNGIIHTSENSIVVQDGKDITYGHTKGTSASATTAWSNISNINSSVSGGIRSSSKTDITNEINTTLGVKDVASVGGRIETTTTTTAEAELSTSVSSGFSHEDSGSKIAENSESVTDGWTTVANRITISTGSSLSTNRNWSTTDSKTVSKTYNAAYFNASGSPLQWKIIKYTVMMPMKYELQNKIDGEWVTTDTAYCLLTTIQGTCRAWMQNNVAYYEHWGTGEPVTWNEFWGTFFTKDQLLAAYQSKLYPNQ